MASQQSSNSGASSMAELMAKMQSTVHAFKKGDVVQGTVKKISKQEITVDIGGKTDALVLEKDRKLMNNLVASLTVGDTVTVSVLNPESDQGMPVVSLRRFMENASWEDLEKKKKDQEKVTVTVTDVTKGGFVVVLENGTSGFLPQSHVSLSQSQQITVGSTLSVVVLELNRADRKVIFSQKHTVSDAEFQEAVKNLKKGEKATVTIINTTPFGIFATVPTQEDKSLDGLIHISEVAWEKVTEISDDYAVGQKIEAVVLGFDKDAKRVDLSLKRLTKDPFEAIAEKFPVDKKVTAAVLSVDATGVKLDLGDGVEGLIKKEKIPPTVTYTQGSQVTATVAEVDAKRRRITLVPVLLEKPIGYR